MEDKTVWSGSPTKLLSELEIVAGFEKIDTTNSNWAKTPNVLSRRLNEIKSNLLDVGIEFERSIGLLLRSSSQCNRTSYSIRA